MLEKWIKTLEQEKQKAVNRVIKSCTNQQTLKSATIEIEVNHATIKNFLTMISNKGFEVNDYLSENNRGL